MTQLHDRLQLRGQMLPPGLMLLLPGLLLLSTRRGWYFVPALSSLSDPDRSPVVAAAGVRGGRGRRRIKEDGDKRPSRASGDVVLFVLLVLGVLFRLLLAAGSSVLAWWSSKMLERVQASDPGTRMGLMPGDGAATAADGGAGLPTASSRRGVSITAGMRPRVHETAVSDEIGLPQEKVGIVAVVRTTTTEEGE